MSDSNTEPMRDVIERNWNHTTTVPTAEYDALRARIAELEARLALAEKVCEAAESVTWFEYVEDDDDVKDAVEGLRVALAAWREGK